jgi:hypothetical protein
LHIESADDVLSNGLSPLFLFFLRFATDIDVVNLAVVFKLGVTIRLELFFIVFLDLFAHDELLKLFFFFSFLHLLCLVNDIFIILFVLLFLIFAEIVPEFQLLVELPLECVFLLLRK